MDITNFGSVAAVMGAAHKRDLDERKRAIGRRAAAGEGPGNIYYRRVGSDDLPDDAAGVLLYHVVWNDEGYDDSMQILSEMVSSAQDNHPGKRRFLLAEIQGHRDENGFLDTDMTDLIYSIHSTLGPYLSMIWTPLVVMTSNQRQMDDVPRVWVGESSDTASLPDDTEIVAPADLGAEIRDAIRTWQNLYNQDRHSGRGKRQSRQTRWVFADLVSH